MKKKIQPLSFWNRFYRLFLPNFIKSLKKESDQDGSWKFWFLGNLIISLLITVSFLVLAPTVGQDFLDETLEMIPSDLEIQFDGEILSTEGIPDPFMWKEIEDDEEFAFFIDTKTNTYSKEDLKEYENAILITAEGFIAKESYEYTELSFAEMYEDSEMSGPIAVTKLEIIETIEEVKWSVLRFVAIFLFIGSYLFLAFIRLLGVLWFAFFGWLLGLIFQIKDWTFSLSLKAALHFSFAILLFAIILTLLGRGFILQGTVFALILYGSNFYQEKRKK